MQLKCRFVRALHLDLTRLLDSFHILTAESEFPWRGGDDIAILNFHDCEIINRKEISNKHPQQRRPANTSYNKRLQ